MTVAITIAIREQLPSATADQVVALIERGAADGSPAALSEQFTLAIDGTPRATVRHVLASAGSDLVGYGQVQPEPAVDGTTDESIGELAVDPMLDAATTSRVIDLLLDAMLEVSGRSLQVWCHGRAAAPHQALRSRGFQVKRELLVLCRSLDEAVPTIELPAGITIRPFEATQDIDAWLALNSRAFAALPDQGSWTRADLEQRMAQGWFDPADMLMAVERSPAERPESDPATSRLVGFHWMKFPDRGGPRPRVAEVFVLAVDPREQDRGLGRALTILGLAQLADEGADRVMLYVDSANRAAIRTYESLGFQQFETDTLYSSPRQ